VRLADVTVRAADGAALPLSTYAGRVLLVVNVASACGFTPQYAGLEALHRRFGARGLAVLGFPCNQFGAQEPGDAAEIASFCSLTYDVTFPVFAKVEVNGAGADPLFAWLKDAAPGLFGTRAVKWNFTKFLVGRDGTSVRRYAPRTAPDMLVADIEEALARPVPAPARTFSFHPRWKEELVVTAPAGAFTLEMPMGVPTVLLPPEGSFDARAPGWAAGLWPVLHGELAEWCATQGIALEIDASAALS
jgi:glutathione peroxidase